MEGPAAYWTIPEHRMSCSRCARRTRTSGTRIPTSRRDNLATSLFTLDHRCERRDICLRLIRQRTARRKMTFVTPGPGIVGGEKARRAVTIIELVNVGSSGQYAVTRIVEINAETIASA